MEFSPGSPKTAVIRSEYRYLNNCHTIPGKRDNDMADRILDTRGLICPLPILKTRKALEAMNRGQVLVVEATDPASVIDFPAYCNQTGNELLAQSCEGDVYRFEIRCG